MEMSLFHLMKNPLKSLYSLILFFSKRRSSMLRLVQLFLSNIEYSKIISYLLYLCKKNIVSGRGGQELSIIYVGNFAQPLICFIWQ